MTTINALLAVTSAAFTQIRDTLIQARHAAASDSFTGFTPEQERALRMFKSLAVGREPSPQATIGGKTYRLFDVVIDSGKLEQLDKEYPDAFVVLGAWLPNGLQYGQTMSVVIDPPEPGDVSVRDRTVVSGTPVYPIHPRLIYFMPDDVEYNADGAEKSRKRPTTLKQVHKYLGWADRRWT